MNPDKRRIISALLLLSLLLWVGCQGEGDGYGGSVSTRVMDEGLMPQDQVHQQGPEPPQVDLLPPSEVLEQIPAKVRVMQQQETVRNAPFKPLANQEVTIEWFERESGKVVRRYSAITTAGGWANVGAVDVVQDQTRFGLRAGVLIGTVQRREMLFRRTDHYTGELKLMPITGDPGDVTGDTLVTVMSIPQQMERHPASYGYVQVEQRLGLSVNQWAIYDSGSAFDAEGTRGLAFTLPVKAQGASGQVMAMFKGRPIDPPGQGSRYGSLEVSDGVAYYKGQLFPSSEEMPEITILLRYFLKADGSQVEFEQPRSLAIADASVVFVRNTDLPEHRLLNVRIDASQFNELSDKAQKGVMEGREVLVARQFKHTLDPNIPIRVKVWGLPYPDQVIPYYVFAIAGLMVLVGLGLGFHEVGRAREHGRWLKQGDRRALRELDHDMEALIEGLTQLELDHLDGDIDESAYEQERERLTTRLALLKQRRAAFLQGEAEIGASASAAS